LFYCAEQTTAVVLWAQYAADCCHSRRWAPEPSHEVHRQQGRQDDGGTRDALSSSSSPGKHKQPRDRAKTSYGRGDLNAEVAAVPTG
jgi:hypothetical protein